jgi:hypothetical protein
MRLEPLENISDEAWDESISRFDSSMLFQESPWLNFLTETQNAALVRFRILDAGMLIGYFVGLIQNKGGFSVLGSPLTAWKTPDMGPSVNRGFDQVGFLGAIDRLCQERNIQLVQISNPILDPDIMHNMGYTVATWTAFSIPLSANEQAMWASISGKCRNRIRKALKNGLTVEDLHQPGAVDEYYDQLREVAARQKFRPPHSIDDVKKIYRHLWPRDRLFALAVKYNDRTIASGLFPHDGRTIYSLSIASRSQYLHLCPNELLYWKAMTVGGECGMKHMYVGIRHRTPRTGGIFKEKFNARPAAMFRYDRGTTVPAKAALRLYHLARLVQRRIGDLLPARIFRQGESWRNCSETH